MDIVPSASDSSASFVYLVNHRQPLNGQSASLVGADSVNEVFKTRVGSADMTHVRTVEDPTVIITPNDVVGFPDGRSFYVTNDHGEKTLISFGSGMSNNNGIARAPNDTFYVTDALWRQITVLERQQDNTFVITDTIPTDRGVDNVSLDDDDVVWGAGFPDTMKLVQHFHGPTFSSPSALRLTRNTDPGPFHGQKIQS